MADSFVTYVGDGSTTTFSIPFGYLDSDHVTAQVDGVETAITFPSTSQALFGSAPGVGEVVRIARETPRTVREVVWQNAANLSAGDLNTSDLQLLYITQEAFDAVVSAIALATDDTFDALSKRIKNVATPTGANDATTKAYVDAATVDIVTNALAAQTAAEAAQAAAEAAQAATELVYDNFDDRYLGQKASDPALDNDGAALIDGALYYNTTNNKMYVYDLGTTSWLAVDTNIPDGTVSLIKLSDLAQATIIGRTSGSGTGVPEALESDAVATIVGAATTGRSGVVELATTGEMSVGTSGKVPDAAEVKSFVDTKIAAIIAEGTAQASTSGSSIDFTSIPAGTKRITVCFVGVSTNGTGDMTIQIGDSGGLETTGYSSASSVMATGVATVSSSTGFVINVIAAADTWHGSVTLTREDSASNTWVASGVLADTINPRTATVCGSKSLSAELDRLSVVTGNTFDAGEINISYEG